jgi:hypothetical protein
MARSYPDECSPYIRRPLRSLQQACQDRCSPSASRSWRCANCPLLLTSRTEDLPDHAMIAAKPRGALSPSRRKTPCFD